LIFFTTWLNSFPPLDYEYLFPSIEMIIQTLDEEASIEKKDHTAEEQLSSFRHRCVADE